MDSHETHMTGDEDIIITKTIRSVSGETFAYATGNKAFSLFTRLGATTFVILSVFTLIETIYLKIRAHPLPKNQKRPLPVAVLAQERPLLKLPKYCLVRAPSIGWINTC